MPLDDLNERHTNVRTDLKNSCDNKLAKGGAEDAIRYARRAYEEATRHPKLANPDPQLTAYRLGHLLMRKTKVTSELIEETVGLFEEAAAARELGPLPKIYMISALNRQLTLPQTDNGRKKILNEMNRILGEAARELRRTKHSRTKPELSIIQDYTFNMLELAAYMASLPYQELEGLGMIHDWIFETEPCILVEYNLGPEKVTRLYAKHIAMGAFKHNMPKIACLGLQLTSDSCCFGLCSQGKIVSRSENREHVRTLASLLVSGERKVQDMDRLFDGESVNRRQGKTRINKKIREILGNNEIEVIEQVKKDSYRLTDQVPIWAIIEKTELARP
jgi:hypothetical protein